MPYLKSHDHSAMAKKPLEVIELGSMIKIDIRKRPYLPSKQEMVPEPRFYEIQGRTRANRGI